MATKFVVRLSDEERQMLTDFVSKGKTSAYKIKHASVLLSVDKDGPSFTDKQASVRSFAANTHSFSKTQ